MALARAIAALALFVIAGSAQASVVWREALKQPASWYASDEAMRVADNVLLYQRDTGGWPKNIDMAQALSVSEKEELLAQKPRAGDSTIDNGATYTQIAFLARVYAAKSFEHHKNAALKGLDYLLNAQYANGGWPQYFPNASGYHQHITFNDDAMIGVMHLLRDVAEQKPPYAFVDATRRQRASEAVRRGIDCILKSQVIVREKRTAWGAQHDARTLMPARGRAYELASLSAGESVGVVRFLMEIDAPSDELINAIESAIRWFDAAKLPGLRYEKRTNRSGGVERVLTRDVHAPPLWARFYEIETNRPIFAGRDGIKKYDVNDIESERRNGYAWYVSTPLALLTEDYPAWQKRLRKK